MTLSGKTAIVTGGTGGLGRVVAQRLFDAGLNVAIPVTSEKSANNLYGRMILGHSRLLTKVADLTEEMQVNDFVAEVTRRFASIEYLVHTAGGYLGGSTVDEVSAGEWERILDINLKTTFIISRALLKVMRQRNFGRIVCISAMAALSPTSKKGPYAVSKRGVVTLMETIAEETKGTGITANAIAPSIIVTEANRQSMPSADVSKWVTPEEISELVLFLCSDEAKSISGNLIKVFGGV